MQTSTINKFFVLQLLSLACFIILMLFLWQNNKGFSLWDEGYLWYGAQRIMLGEVPIRDFMAYDPARYYWSAMVMQLLGSSGLIALRVAIAIFQAISLFMSLLLIAYGIAAIHTKQSFAYLLLSALILILWMFNREKIFDISTSILLIGSLAFLIQNPTPKRYFLAGLCLGFAGVMGRNHGVYGLIGGLSAMLWLVTYHTHQSSFCKCFVLWCVGITIGFAPILMMLWLVPDFATAFWQGLLTLIKRGTTNLTLPIPWSWDVMLNAASLKRILHDILLGLFFMGLMIFSILSIAWVALQKFHRQSIPPVLIATACLALPYTHYAYSRADITHLALGIFPTLIGMLVVFAAQSQKIKWFLVLMLLGATIPVVILQHSGIQYIKGPNWVETTIAGDTLYIDPHTAKDLALLNNLTTKFAPNGQSFIAVPFWPGAYAALERKSPMWAIFALWKRNEAFEKAEIERIQIAKPGFIIIFDLALNGQERWRFSNTYPLVHQYIIENYVRLSNYTENPAYQIYTNKAYILK